MRASTIERPARVAWPSEAQPRQSAADDLTPSDATLRRVHRMLARNGISLSDHEVVSIARRIELNVALVKLTASPKQCCRREWSCTFESPCPVHDVPDLTPAQQGIEASMRRRPYRG